MTISSTSQKERKMRGIVGIIVTLVFAAIVGVGAYQLGLAQGLGATGTAVAPAPYYYHPFFFGGFLFPLLFILLIVFAIRGAFSRGWNRGYGGGWGGPGSYQSPRERLEELHREMHGEKPKDTGTAPPPPSGR
jgi:hypothetical protein